MKVFSCLVWIAVTFALTGCGAAIAAGAGAGAAIAYSERGVSSTVDGLIDQVLASSRAVFTEMNIQETGRATEDSGAERELKGRSGEIEVTVDLERQSDGFTNVEVFARRSAVDWDRDYARDVLSRIISRQ